MISSERFDKILGRYKQLRLALAGDFCLDRYLEIDPALEEKSLETNLPVHNVVKVRSQPGAAGTILNNLEGLGIGEIRLIGFCGEDGEGYELQRALRKIKGARLDDFFCTPDRRTFTYCKPLLVRPGQPPEELNRLDSKNWSPTPPELEEKILEAIFRATREVDAVILMDQVDQPDTGAMTSKVLRGIGALVEKSNLLMVGDSRRGMSNWPSVTLKMNAAEFRSMTQSSLEKPEDVAARAGLLSRKLRKQVFVTLAEKGMVGAGPDGRSAFVPAFPVQGPIDIVGAGDSVTANLTSALAAGADLEEALWIAAAAASVVIHQLGTTGVASPEAIRKTLNL